MVEEHWFDVFSKTSMAVASRRAVIPFLAAVLHGLPFTGLTDRRSASGKGKGNGRKNKKGKGKGKGNKKPKPPKQPDICDTTWPGAGQQEDRDTCRRIRGECPPGGNREFCIVDDFPGHEGEQVARCCKAGEPCCGAHCCPAGQSCCRGEHGATCCRAGGACCGGRCCGTDKPWTACCDGICVSTDTSRDHCGLCGNPCAANEFCSLGECECDDNCDDCPAGLTWCGNRCVDTKTNREHCGGCFALNPNNLKCCDGNLCTYIDGVCCGGTCYPSDWPSCG